MKAFRQIKSIFLGELLSYFNSSIAYIFMVVFVMLTSILFMSNFFLIGRADMRSFFDILPIVLSVFIPAITMRIWAEEKKCNTFELLLTFPMNSYKIVLGKFLGGLVFYLSALAGTIFIPLILVFSGNPDLGTIFGGYLGACFVGAFFLSIGIFISGLCKDQIVAFIVSMIACFFFYLVGLDFIASTIDGWIGGLGSILKINFGMTRHFSSFEKGVIDNRDVLYFIVMTASFLILNFFSIEDRMRPKAKYYFFGTIGMVLFISIILNSLVFSIPLGRFDLTQGKIYTITESTKKILQSLKSPVNVKLYISPADKMPTAFKTLEQDIKDQLEELRVVSKGKLNFKTFHMQVTQDSNEKKEESLEDRLQKKGIQPFQVQSIEEDELGIKLVYSSISIGYKEKEEQIISRVVPQTLHKLEYDLVSKIYRMTLDKKPKVALIAPYEEKAVDPNMLALFRQLGQRMPTQFKDDKYSVLDALLRYEEYDLRRIKLQKEDSDLSDIDTLIIVEPESLNERQRYEINKFLYEGGNVIISAQGYEYDYDSSGRGISIIPRKKQLGINELLNNYGIKISEKLFMDENHEVLSISGGKAFGLFAFSTPVKAPIHVKVDNDMMNKNISITGNLDSLFYLWGSSLELNHDTIKKYNLTKKILFSSSKESWLFDYKGGSLTQKDFESSNGYQKNIPLAVLLEGSFPNAFEGKILPEWPKPPETPGGEIDNKKDIQKEEPKTIKPVLNPKSGKLLIIGCSTMFQEDFIKSGGAINLFVNSVDSLTLGSELINIRSRQPINRTIKKLNKMTKLWYRFLTICLLPIVFILLGFFRIMLRKKEKEKYLQQLAEIK